MSAHVEVEAPHSGDIYLLVAETAHSARYRVAVYAPGAWTTGLYGGYSYQPRSATNFRGRWLRWQVRKARRYVHSRGVAWECARRREIRVEALERS